MKFFKKNSLLDANEKRRLFYSNRAKEIELFLKK